MPFTYNMGIIPRLIKILTNFILNLFHKIRIFMMTSARIKRVWHPDFLEYMEFIVNHPAYKDLPNKHKGNGEIHWVSPSDKDRAQWWDNKIKEMNLTNRAEVARSIHPSELNGLKPCQICGKKLNIHYVYPNKNTLKKLNSLCKLLRFNPYNETIHEIYDKLAPKLGNNILIAFKEVFGISTSPITEKNELLNFIIENCTSRLSPGAMSNPPDRLDGFHTYNGCCRSKEDTGRHADNLKRYTQDRRAYENWAEGDFNLSNRLMGEFQQYEKEITCPSCNKQGKVSADHIGPISLGFTHRPMFNPLCQSCNSAKNNRMAFSDVILLIEHENNGEQVVSEHSKYAWNTLKGKITNDAQALELSKIMRAHLHNVLTLFSLVASLGRQNFLLQFLHPEYSYFDYRFENFDPLDLSKLKTIKTPLDSLNKSKNAERCVRISFESLQDYQEKENRNVKEFKDSETSKVIKEVLILLKQKDYANGIIKLKLALQKLSEQAMKGVSF